jgi:rod shape-determining protein MreC
MRPRFRRNLIIVLAIAVACLGIARYTRGNAWGTALREFLSPVQGGVVSVWQYVSAPVRYIGHASEISQENQKLQKQVRDLTWENNILREYQYENKQLTKLLNFQQLYKNNFTLLGGRVISRSPSSWYSTLVIDRGSDDGVRKGQPVVSDSGLVGQIVSVGKSTAQGLLILDNNGAVGAMVQTTRTLGVVQGNKDEMGTLQMIDLPYEAKLQEGQVVVTSGLGGIFPRGIPIGKVERLQNGGSELEKYAVITPLVDFDRLEELFVITDVKQVVTDTPLTTDKTKEKSTATP